MQYKGCPGQLDEVARVQAGGQRDHMRLDQSNEIRVPDVSRGDEEKPFGLLLQQVRIHEVAVRCHDNPFLGVGQCAEDAVGGPIALRKLQGVNRILAGASQLRRESRR
jgi:hypothetical protein